MGQLSSSGCCRGWGVGGGYRFYSHMPEAKVLNPEKFSWTLKLGTGD